MLQSGRFLSGKSSIKYMSKVVGAYVDKELFLKKLCCD